MHLQILYFFFFEIEVTLNHRKGRINLFVFDYFVIVYEFESDFRSRFEIIRMGNPNPSS